MSFGQQMLFRDKSNFGRYDEAGLPTQNWNWPGEDGFKVAWASSERFRRAMGAGATPILASRRKGKNVWSNLIIRRMMYELRAL
jgi:hypothetical protein